MEADTMLSLREIVYSDTLKEECFWQEGFAKFDMGVFGLCMVCALYKMGPNYQDSSKDRA